MAFTHDEDHYRFFGSLLKEVRAKFGGDKVDKDDTARLALQRSQLEQLFALEQQFRYALIHHRWGPGVYELFVKHICDVNGNILTARPYFRERQGVCIGPISAALEARNASALYRYNFNYQFVAFVLKARAWKPGSDVVKLARQIERVRSNIIEFNMPLAIAQARFFWSKAPAKAPVTHLQYMDLVQIAADGLVSAVDKFVLPSNKKFRSEKRLNEMFRKFRPMMVQRMVGNFIESYSETMIHFYPKDKRKLYRANKYLVRLHGSVDYDRVAAAVNRDSNGAEVEEQSRTTASEINDLLNAASAVTVTTETSTVESEDGERENPLDRCAAAEEWRPDVQYERNEVHSRLQEAIARLPMVSRKLLRLKGVTAAAMVPA